jgi:hypothetical protein
MKEDPGSLKFLVSSSRKALARWTRRNTPQHMDHRFHLFLYDVEVQADIIDRQLPVETKIDSRVRSSRPERTLGPTSRHKLDLL